MEVDLAGSGWNVGKLFKRRGAPARQPAQEPAPAAVVRPLRRANAERASEAALPRFRSTASDQPSIQAGDRVDGMLARLRFAFTPSQPVADRRMFAGREATLRTIISSIEDQRLHVVIYGERGIGKTSLLRMLSHAASEARYIVIYTSCGANSNFDDTMRAVAAEIPLLFHGGVAPTAAEAEKGSSLLDLLPPGPVTPRQFSDLSAKLTGTRVLIILDEFDRCESGSFRRDVAELIKNLSDRLGRVQLVLAGVAGDLTELVAHIPSIRRNIFALRVAKMTDEEIMKVVSNGEREVGFTFEPAASELVVAVSNGSPYLAHLICHHAGQQALMEGRTTVATADATKAVEQTHAEFASRIPKPVQARIQRLAEHGHSDDLRRAARTCLNVGSPFGVRDLQDSNQIDEASARRVLDVLAGEGVIVPMGDDDAGVHYGFTEEGLPLYLWVNSALQTLQSGVSAVQAARR